MFESAGASGEAMSGDLPPGTDVRRPWAEPFDALADEVGPVGRMLAGVPGGRDLVELLRELEGWAWDAGSLVEVVAAYERLGSWARAGAAAAAARLAERPEMNPSWPPHVGRPSESNGAPTELSLRLGVSRRAAATLVGMGEVLRGVHHSTGDALAVGHVDWPKARVIVESLEHVPPAVALEVEDRVLPSAAGATTTQLRRQIARLLEEIDPQDAAERHEHARRKRCVSRPRALPDGMASMTATLTVDAAVRLDACLQAAAEAARSDGDGRSVEQLRADALDAMGEVAWATGFIGGTGSGEPGLVSAQSAGVPESRPQDPLRKGGQGAPGDTPAEHVDLEEPLGQPPGGPGGAASRADDGAPSSDPAGPPADADAAGRRARMPLSRRAGPPARIHVTVGYGTLLGLDDRPGELAGFGPVSADVARRLAMDGTWRRLLVDGPSGAVMDIGTTRYTPPADMVELVRERNRTCAVPTCGMPARRCQTDHTVPFPRHGGRPTAADGQDGRTAAGRPAGDGDPSPAEGRTATDNLGPLCATHHLFKTHGGFRLAQPRPGSFVVRTPSGHVYLQGPDQPPGVPDPRVSLSVPVRAAEPPRPDEQDGAEADAELPDPGPEDCGRVRRHPAPRRRWEWHAGAHGADAGIPGDEPPPF
jgi:hypothetical protein